VTIVGYLLVVIVGYFIVVNNNMGDCECVEFGGGEIGKVT
jgi:hypothetical protein